VLLWLASDEMKQRINNVHDVRAELARLRWPLYLLAAEVRVHPSRLSYILNDYRPLTPTLRGRIKRAILEESERRATAAG
jgi:hypothetical protein